MGPRIREDNGRGRGSIGRELGRKMDCRPRLHGGRLCAGDGDGSPHPRGQREGAREYRKGVGTKDGLSSPASRGVGSSREWGWVPASARTTGGGAGVANGR